MDYLLFNSGCHFNSNTGIYEINDQVYIKTPESINRNIFLNGNRSSASQDTDSGNMQLEMEIQYLDYIKMVLQPHFIRIENNKLDIKRRQADYKTVVIMLPIDNAKYG